MSDEDPGRLADDLEQQAGEMEKRSGKLSREIDDVGEDWERKRADPSVPGAPEDQSDAEDDTQATGNPPQGDSPAEDEGGEDGEDDKAAPDGG